MSQRIDWAKLTAQGRVKREGIAWTPEELTAIHEKGMTVEEVRAGMLDPKDRGKELETREELEERAKKAGVKFDAEVVSDSDLKAEVDNQEQKQVVLEDLDWNELKALAREKGVYEKTQKKEEVIKALKDLN